MDLAKATSLWDSFKNIKIVQQGAKSLALGTILTATYVGLTSLASKFRNADASVASLKEEIPEGLWPIVDLVHAQDSEFTDIMVRLSTFRKFHTQSYDEILVALGKATTVKQDVYASLDQRNKNYTKINTKVFKVSPKVSFTASYEVRKAFQGVIEAIRHLRAVLEVKVPSTLDDFDEIAVDFNSKVEQMCTDAIQDSSLE